MQDDGLAGAKTVKELYDLVAAPESSVGYEAFRQKVRRLAVGNEATTKRVVRGLAGRTRKVKADPFLQTRFVAFDGEGWDTKYTLLANSMGEYIVNPDGLSTIECLDFLSGRYTDRVKRVFFSFGYDVNHIVKDFSDEQLYSLLRGNVVEYGGHKVHYIPGKILAIDGLKFYDVFSFFATSFINVVGLMLGEDRITDSLRKGKESRGSFDEWDMGEIIKYNAEELDLLVEIMDLLNQAFVRVDVHLRDWYGPGAVAKYWFKEHGVKPSERHSAGSVSALNSAYYGGRFEQTTLGTVKNVYEYDLHSAYPSVMAGMPYFRTFRKVKSKHFTGNPYSLWHISFDLREDQRKTSPANFLPLPVRDREGRICFPMVGKGWYWYPEIKVMLDFFPNANVTIHDGYTAETEGQPFAWVRDLYDYRRTLKENGDLAQYAIKVGLNSLYGKTAQRVGSNPFFSLAWAGYITSSTRAALARAGYEGGSDHVLGFATDALFTDRRFTHLPLSDNLGDWEEESFAKAVFFQSGVYRMIKSDGTIDDRYRGSPMRKGIDAIIAQLREKPSAYPEVPVVRFISHMLAIKAPKAYGHLRLQFVRIPHHLAIDAPYKRHYHGFSKGVGKGNDYSKLLKQRIDSTPKVFMEDNDRSMTSAYLSGRVGLGIVETQPPPLKDQNTARLLEEAERLGLEEGYDEVSRTEALSLASEDLMK